jgi:hypothetical protein
MPYIACAELVGVRLVLLHHVGTHLLLSNILMIKHTINQINLSLLPMRRKVYMLYSARKAFYRGECARQGGAALFPAHVQIDALSAR